MGTQGGASALRAHSRFFDHLVDLVPAKYYLDSGEDKVNLKYLKKSARDEAKAAFKQQYKAAKRAKLDPEQAKGTVQLQREAAERAKQQQQNGAAHSDSEEGDSGDDSGSDDEGRGQQHHQPQRAGGQQGTLGQLAIPKGKPPSREELQQRLQAKLEEMRKARKAEEQQQKAQDAKQWRDKSLQEGRKKVARGAMQPKASGSKQSLAAGAAPGGANQQQQQQQKGQQQKEQQGQQQGGGKGGKRQREEEGGLTFNKLDFGSEPRHQKKRQRKQSKQQLLEAAQAKQAAAAELAGSADGKAQLAKEAWGAALQRAKGDKVLDDPRLLKKSLKKEAKLKAKKAKAWQERLKTQAEQQQAKQHKRRENIDSRIKAKQDKKKQKRENKLLRAGFEGRKQGFIDTPKRPAAGGQ